MKPPYGRDTEPARSGPYTWDGTPKPARSHVRDRRSFESLYVHEPGGILFEVSSDGPGVTVDEDVEDFGSSLKLPDQYAQDRAMIEGQLPEVDVPGQ